MKARSLNIRAMLTPLRIQMRRMNLQPLPPPGPCAASRVPPSVEGRLRRSLDALLGHDLPPRTRPAPRPTVWRDRRGGLRMRPAAAVRSGPQHAEVRIHRERDDSLPASSAGRMVMAGRFADVCRALDRLAEQAATLH